MAESLVARSAPIPDALRRGILASLRDHSGFLVVVGQADTVACPVCGEAHALFELVQHIDPDGAIWSYQCLTCPRAA